MASVEQPRVLSAPALQHTKGLYLLAPRFYILQFCLLALSAALLIWLSRDEGLDRLLSNYWFDATAARFPLQHNYWLDLLNHRLLKALVIAGGAAMLLYGLWRHQPRMITVALLFGLGALSVAILKATSHHSCPWDLVEYGGKALSYPLFGAVPANSGPGRCFPGGHASSGFAVMALFFLFYRERPALAWMCLGAGLLLGLAMGYGQVMRGAHFFTHNLWAGWWVWLTQVTFYGLLSRRLVKDPRAGARPPET